MSGAVPASLLNGLLNIALFLWPVPLLAWLDRPKAGAGKADG